MRLREAGSLAQGPPAGGCQSQDLIPRFSGSKPQLSSLPLPHSNAPHGPIRKETQLRGSVLTLALTLALREARLT